MIQIKNWDKYQSYKDRRPPWIRFHRTILDDYHFQMMNDSCRALLPMLWLLACENDDPTSGMIEIANEEIAFRLRQKLDKMEATINQLEVAGFITRNGIVTESLRNRYETVPPETEVRGQRQSSEVESEADISSDLNPCAVPIVTPPPPANKKEIEPIHPDYLEFKTNGRTRTWMLTQSFFDQATVAYPGLEILKEIRKAWLWVENNPTKRKTAKGMQAFLTRWFARVNDRPVHINGNSKAKRSLDELDLPAPRRRFPDAG